MRVLFILSIVFCLPAMGGGDAATVAASPALNLPAAGTQDGEEIALRIKSWRIRAEIAGTEASRQRGLMQRATLCRDCGMLFVFEHPDRVSFWMQDTPLALSIAFIGEDGRILGIEDMAPKTVTPHTPARAALYALEMNRGWFLRHHIHPGDRIQGVKRERQ